MSQPAAQPAESKYDEVVAEDAPIGVLMWPVRHPDYAPNYTLATVAIVRNDIHTYVVWTYENGRTRSFNLGDKVTCLLPKGA